MWFVIQVSKEKRREENPIDAPYRCQELPWIISKTLINGYSSVLLYLHTRTSHTMFAHSLTSCLVPGWVVFQLLMGKGKDFFSTSESSTSYNLTGDPHKEVVTNDCYRSSSASKSVILA